MRWFYLFFGLTFILGCNTPINPEAATINARLGVAYLAQHDLVRAKEKLLLALAENSNDPIVNDAFAYFLETTGELAQAESYYLKAIKLASSKGAVWNNYGTFLYRQGRYSEALHYFLLATQDIYYMHIGNAYANAADCAVKLHDFTLAKSYLHKAQQINHPCNPNVGGF